MDDKVKRTYIWQLNSRDFSTLSLLSGKEFWEWTKFYNMLRPKNEQ